MLINSIIRIAQKFQLPCIFLALEALLAGAVGAAGLYIVREEPLGVLISVACRSRRSVVLGSRRRRCDGRCGRGIGLWGPAGGGGRRGVEAGSGEGGKGIVVIFV
jgi:hypothetical protein